MSDTTNSPSGDYAVMQHVMHEQNIRNLALSQAIDFARSSGTHLSETGKVIEVAAKFEAFLSGKME